MEEWLRFPEIAEPSEIIQQIAFELKILRIL